MKKRSELKEMMAHVRQHVWYNIVDYMTDAKGFVTDVKLDNGEWHEVKNIIEIC